MSTFVVYLAGNRSGAFRGKVRHVRTGEESSFSSAADLLVFLERMNAVYQDGPAAVVGKLGPGAPQGSRETHA